ncbi:polysaccharide deacetylase family protein [Bacillus sp. RG28]|uniref:Polysaccharide deacetylase family protein n=1 Tax=Gottfriedia endophytica TaxID=2820819 RepID=A0A940NQT6_9BACI|nr:polysaccharide deacetylase family protein [Gottfriedia endophytica]MBP0726584.1 polysaccharide deacetylase family protein [Gottfriedia endophytica]
MKKIICILLLFVMLWLPSKTFAQVKVPILIYHSIDNFEGHGIKQLYVSPDSFEKQMLYLKNNGYTLLTFERWQDINKVKKPILITFDDGYKNNLNVYKVFQKVKDEHFQPTATFFVISDFIGRRIRLTKDDIQMLVNSGMFSIQSHSATHPDLRKAKDLEYELKGSKEKIQKITGKPVIAIAYPYGDYNQKVIDETKKYYQYGISTIPGPYTKKGIKNENYLLPRIYITYDTTIDEFANKVKVQ